MAPTFEVYEGDDGNFWWRFKPADGVIISSGQGYATKAAAVEAVQLIRLYAAYAPVVEQTNARLANAAERTPHHVAQERIDRLNKIARK